MAVHSMGLETWNGMCPYINVTICSSFAALKFVKRLSLECNGSY